VVIGLAALSLALGLLCTPLARRLALRTGTVDRPGPLKRQRAPVPYLGGLAVLAAIVPGAAAGRAAVLAPLGVATVLGTLDDRVALAPWIRLAGQVVVGIGIAVAVPTRVGGVAGWVLVVLATVVLVNGVNLLDGLDGLAAGVVGVASAAFAALLTGDGRDLAVSFAFALLAFLVFNRPPARIYLGDGGSYLLGAGLAALSAYAWAPAATAVSPTWAAPVAGLCVVALPAAEVAFAVVRRVRAGTAVTSGDRRHPYDMLVGRGWPAAAASGAYIAAEALVSVPAVVLAGTGLGVGWTALSAVGLVAAAGAVGSLTPGQAS